MKKKTMRANNKQKGLLGGLVLWQCLILDVANNFVFCETVHWTFLFCIVKLNLWNISWCCENIVQRWIQDQARRQGPFPLSHCKSETFLDVGHQISRSSNFALVIVMALFEWLNEQWRDFEVFERFKIQICLIEMAS